MYLFAGKIIVQSKQSTVQLEKTTGTKIGFLIIQIYLCTSDLTELLAISDMLNPLLVGSIMKVP